jgi:hypothetical protein
MPQIVGRKEPDAALIEFLTDKMDEDSLATFYGRIDEPTLLAIRSLGYEILEEQSEQNIYVIF